MPKVVTFNLGPSTLLATRVLTITRMHLAGDDSPPAAEHDQDEGAVETVSVSLPDNTIWQATLVDTLSSGEVVPIQVIQFHTGSLMHLGPPANEPASSEFAVLHMEDESSSSSQSSSSSSNSSSSSSSSISTSSSSSSSSSVSTSSSSVSTSSSSSSQSSTSSSQSTSSSSSSQST